MKCFTFQVIPFFYSCISYKYFILNDSTTTTTTISSKQQTIRSTTTTTTTSNINSFHLSDRYDQLQLMFFGNFWNFFPVQTICEGEVLQNIKVRKLLTWTWDFQSFVLESSVKSCTHTDHTGVNVMMMFWSSSTNYLESLAFTTSWNHQSTMSSKTMQRDIKG